MIDYLELFKPFHIVGELCGVLPFTIHSYVESKIRHSSKLQNGTNEVKLFPATQVVCNVLIFGAVPLLASAWTIIRLGQIGLLSPGMNNLDGLVCGMGTLLALVLLAFTGVTRRKLGCAYADLLTGLHMRTTASILLHITNHQDLRPVRTTAWKVLFPVILLTPTVCILVTCIIVTACAAHPDGEFHLFISGEILLDILSIASFIGSSVMPVWIVGAFMVQSAMAATFTRIKVNKLEAHLKAELYSLTFTTELDPDKDDESNTGWMNKPRLWSSNLLRAPGISADWVGSQQDIGHFRGIISNGRQGLSAVLAPLNRELRMIEADHRMMSEVIKAGESITIVIIVGFLVFSGYNVWGGLTGVINNPSSSIIHQVKVATALLMTVEGLYIIWNVCEEGYQLQEQTKKIAQLLRRYQQTVPSLSWEDTFLVEQTCNSLLELPLKYELGQFLTVDRSTFVTICATILTNLIVLVQLKTPPSS